MKNFITYAILLTAVLLGCLAATGVHAEGNDTYNFYFQKAPGPVTVNQGGNAAQVVVPNGSPAPAAAPLAIPAAASSVASAEETSDRKKFHLSFGYAITSPYSPASNYDNFSGKKDKFLSGQYAIRAEFDLGERLSVEGGVYKLQKNVNYSSQHYNTRGEQVVGMDYTYKDPYIGSNNNVIDFSLGAALHLARMRTTTFSLLGGLVTMPKLTYVETRGAGTDRYSAPVDGVTHKKTAYVGARVRLIADNTWGLDLSYRSATNFEQGIAMAGLTFAL